MVLNILGLTYGVGILNTIVLCKFFLWRIFKGILSLNFSSSLAETFHPRAKWGPVFGRHSTHSLQLHIHSILRNLSDSSVMRFVPIDAKSTSAERLLFHLHVCVIVDDLRVRRATLHHLPVCSASEDQRGDRGHLYPLYLPDAVQRYGQIVQGIVLVDAGEHKRHSNQVRVQFDS